MLSGDSDYDASACFLTVDFKRILRAIPVTDDAMYCVVVGQFSTPSLRGQAFLPCGGSDAKYRPQVPFRSVTIMAYTSASGPVLDGGDNLPFTSPHESCHTLCDLIHTEPQTDHNRTELMGTGTSRANTLGATKRLSDGPYEVRMQKNGSTTMSIVSVKLAETMRTVAPRRWRRGKRCRPSHSPSPGSVTPAGRPICCWKPSWTGGGSPAGARPVVSGRNRRPSGSSKTFRRIARR